VRLARLVAEGSLAWLLIRVLPPRVLLVY